MARIIILAAASILILSAAIPALSDAGWREIAGTRVIDGDRVEFSLRHNGSEAVLIERRNGKVERMSSCSGRSYLETSGDPTHTVRRDVESSQVCFELATASLLGFRKIAASPGEKVNLIQNGLSVTRITNLPPAFDWQEVVLDADSLLPLTAVASDGTVVEWHYDAINAASTEAVAIPKPPSSSDEHYVAMTRVEAGAAAQLAAEPPVTVGDVPFKSAFAYLGGQLKSPRYYFIWSNGDGEVQLIVTAGLLPPETPTLEDLGNGAYVLNIQDSETHTQIFATSKDLHIRAVDLMRPDFANAVK